MNPEALNSESREISPLELQEFLNDPAIDIPEGRRDITSNPENIPWLIRNILIRNADKVTPEYWDALRKARHDQFNSTD